MYECTPEATASCVLQVRGCVDSMLQRAIEHVRHTWPEAGREAAVAGWAAGRPPDAREEPAISGTRTSPTPPTPPRAAGASTSSSSSPAAASRRDGDGPAAAASRRDGDGGIGLDSALLRQYQGDALR